MRNLIFTYWKEKLKQGDHRQGYWLRLEGGQKKKITADNGRWKKKKRMSFEILDI